MVSPFPGMDPYLEQATFWPEFHSRLIVAIADALAPSLLPSYYVAVETRTYLDNTSEELLIGIPDTVVLSASEPSTTTSPRSPSAGAATTVKPQTVMLPMPVEIKERYLEIREASSDAVITVVEVLSPTDKRPGKGRLTYEAKRRAVLGSASHLVEIDLLRAYEPMAMRPVSTGAASCASYRILVSRSECRPQADLYEFTLKQPVPAFPLPLKAAGEQVMLDLQPLIRGLYERGGYAIRIDYQVPVPPPSLSKEDQAWVSQVIGNND